MEPDASNQEINEEKKDEKDFYKRYREFITELSNKEKKIMADLSNYREKALKGGLSTIDDETNIKKQLSEFTQKLEKLENAYSNRNAPSGYPPQELDRKQKELQK